MRKRANEIERERERERKRERKRETGGMAEEEERRRMRNTDESACKAVTFFSSFYCLNHVALR